jgi:hypothetical protein
MTVRLNLGPRPRKLFLGNDDPVSIFDHDPSDTEEPGPFLVSLNGFLRNHQGFI